MTTYETTSALGRLRAARQRSIARARAIWSELDHAQQRTFLLRTGLDDAHPHRPEDRRRREIEELERLYHWRPRSV